MSRRGDLDDDKIIEQIKRLGVLEEQMRTMRTLMERAWFILEPENGPDSEPPAEGGLDDLKEVMRQLDALIPYPNREDRLWREVRSEPANVASRLRSHETSSHFAVGRGR
jgi:hypothetical protein